MNPLAQVRGILRRAILNIVTDGSVQTAQVSRGGTFSGGSWTSEGVEIAAYPPGVRFVPQAGITALVGAPSAQQANSVVLALLDPDNPPPTGSAPGTGGLYLGDYRVYLAGDGTLVLAGDADSGRAASDAVPVDSKLQTELVRIESEFEALKTAYDTHTHSGVTPGMGASGPPASPAPSPGSPGPTASAKVLIPPD